ncbi:hypothetical protein BHE74_00009644 [Ensete ventricosum]|uniref:Uncharacterized protein n=1 Tax=Ensete ventricosum TaxID=4639 RepID=A0A444EJN3_ENSVE|nr:hypothetical protein GW17_00025835 [Ensete ventricosum]RWW81940.1 hypothetical protein BHE74_00009644 [Ensete ventricosum]RZR72268.1 hypothetical protein BHM03_00011828 [Ensete ventricosum]
MGQGGATVSGGGRGWSPRKGEGAAGPTLGRQVAKGKRQTKISRKQPLAGPVPWRGEPGLPVALKARLPPRAVRSAASAPARIGRRCWKNNKTKRSLNLRCLLKKMEEGFKNWGTKT